MKRRGKRDDRYLYEISFLLSPLLFSRDYQMLLCQLAELSPYEDTSEEKGEGDDHPIYIVATTR